jgi:hypothetical protein
MDLKEALTLITICFGFVGGLVAFVGFLFGRVGRVEFEQAYDRLNNSLNKLQNELTKKDRDSVEVHAGFVTRRELESAINKIEDKIDKHFGPLEISTSCIEKTMNEISLKVATISATMSANKDK